MWNASYGLLPAKSLERKPTHDSQPHGTDRAALEQFLERLHGVNRPRAGVVEAHVRRRLATLPRRVAAPGRLENISEQGRLLLDPLRILCLLLLLVVVVAVAVAGRGGTCSVFHDQHEIRAEASLRGAYESPSFQGFGISRDDHLEPENHNRTAVA